MSQAGKSDSTKGGLPALVYKGEVIHERHEMLSLTDMWKAEGGDFSRKPAEWARSADAKRFIEFVAISLNVGNSHLLKGASGRGGSTFAHWQVALAYAKYLSPEFHMWCNTVVRERMEGAPRTDHLIAEDLGRDARSAIGGIVKAVVPGLLAEALTSLLPGMVDRHLEADSRVVAIGYKPALAVLEERKVPPRRRRAFSQKVSARLRRFSTAQGHPYRISRETGRYLFHVDVIAAWLAAEGDSLIRTHVASVAGQGVLPFGRRPVQP